MTVNPLLSPSLHTIAVALSGGVDSAVAAWCLREQGRQVLGLHADLGLTDETKRDRLRELAAFLGIPLMIVPLKTPFQRLVIDTLIREYRQARTPNPCVVCNRKIKFNLLFNRALELGADGLATGHYARILGCPDGEGLTVGRGLDTGKDQSYFLHRLDPAVLPRLVFPLGTDKKEDVRALARRLGLPVAIRTESQDACFLPPGGYRELVQEAGETLLNRSGEVVDRQGKTLGTHEGLYAYTIGQRRGLGRPAARPYYVIRMEAERNRLVLGFREDLASQGLWVRAPHRLCPMGDWEGLRVAVQIRYRHRPVGGTLVTGPGRRLGVRFDAPQEAVTPGQAAVFYQEDRVLGGGWIEEAWR